MFDKIKMILKVWKEKRQGRKFMRKLSLKDRNRVYYYTKTGIPVYRTKFPIYQIGSPDPVHFYYGETRDPYNKNITSGVLPVKCFSPISGSDINVSIVEDDIEKVLENVSGISYHKDNKNNINGIIYILSTKENKDYLNKTVKLKLTVLNKDNKAVILFEENVTFINKNYAAGVDDIITEEK